MNISRAAIVYLFIQNYLKIEDMHLATCKDCFLIFIELFPTPSLVTATEVSWKQSAPLRHRFLTAYVEVHSMLTERPLLSQGSLAGVWSLGKQQHSNGCALLKQFLYEWCVHGFLLLCDVSRKRIICKARLYQYVSFEDESWLTLKQFPMKIPPHNMT